MRTGKKTKTSCFKPKKPLAIQYKPRHQSLIINLNEDSLKTIFEVIDEMLRSVHHQIDSKDNHIKKISQFMSNFDVSGNSYFILEEPEEIQILNVVDDEPQTQEMKKITVVPPGHIKSLVTVPAQPKQQSQEEEEAVRESIHKEEKQRRDTIIGKLKKDYSHTLNIKYLSESMPIEESRAFFKQPDTPYVDTLRSNFKKNVLVKKSTKAVKYWHEELPHRKENRMPTTMKKNKAFIDNIDPTSSYYNKTVTVKDEPMKNQRRGSLNFTQPFSVNEEAVTAKATNYSIVKQKVAYLGLRSSNFTIKLPSILNDREQLCKRVNLSVHTNANVHFRSIQNSQRQPRPNNSVSVSSLPNINRK